MTIISIVFMTVLFINVYRRYGFSTAAAVTFILVPLVTLVLVFVYFFATH